MQWEARVGAVQIVQALGEALAGQAAGLPGGAPGRVSADELLAQMGTRL